MAAEPAGYQVVSFRPPASKRQPRPGEDIRNAADALSGEVVSEDRVALEFVARHGAGIRYDHVAKSWFVYDETRWKRDCTFLAFSWARALSRDLAVDDTPSAKKSAGRASFARGVEEHASRDQRLAVTGDAWDRNPYLLGTPGGTVDLKSGDLRPAQPADFITKLAAVAPADIADCPRWVRFLDEATGGDAELIVFLQRWAGYCLTGSTAEQSLCFFYGPGGNGKSVFCNTLQGILGEYAKAASLDTFTASTFDRHPEELAVLAGARMVSASETDAGKRWAEARVKSLTGGDVIRARFMRQDSFEYRPAFKLTILGNHAPTIANLDDAIRRRFLIVPFTRRPAVPDPGLEEALRAEWPAILRWMIEGALAWQRDGLSRPQSVMDATRQYFEEQDVFGQWLDENCDVEPANPAKFEGSVKLFENWSEFAKQRGEPAGNQRDFKGFMRRRQLGEAVQIKAIGTKGYRGIRLKIASSYHDDR